MDLTALLERRRRPIVVIVAVLLLALVLEAGFYLGHHAAYRGMGAKPRHYREMQAQLLAVENALRAREADLAIQSTRHEVDRQALELVRKEMAGQKEEMAGLVEALGFYRSLISPDDAAPGLSLRGIELMAGDEPREFFYRIVVQQDARNHEQLSGALTLVVAGLVGEDPVEYALADLDPNQPDGGAALAFRYYQSVKGRLVLPEGFDPRGVTVEATTVSPHAYQTRAEYPWQLEERFTHVGK